MPKGNPTAQTRASDKYQKKVGYLSKSYKLKRDVVDRFSKACEHAGISQAAQITKMMEQFIAEQKE